MRFKGSAACATVSLLLVAACNGDKNKSSSDALAQDSSLTRDLQLSNRDTMAQPQLQDVPATPPAAIPPAVAVQPAPVTSAPVASAPATSAPVTSTPVARATPRPVTRSATSPSAEPGTRAATRTVTPTVTRPPERVAQTPTPDQTETKTMPPPPQPTPVRTQIPAVMTPSGNTVEDGPASSGRGEGKVGIVAAGTSLALETGQRVCTNTNTVGDRITATLADAVTGSNGVVIPAGATAVLEVTSLARSEQAGENMSIGLGVRSLMYEGKSYPLDGQIIDVQTEKVRSQGGTDAAKVLGGAAVGGIAGNVLGGRKAKGTIIGAAAGAAAGAILANQTSKYDACIPSGSRMTVRLDSPMSVQAASL